MQDGAHVGLVDAHALGVGGVGRGVAWGRVRRLRSLAWQAAWTEHKVIGVYNSSSSLGVCLPYRRCLTVRHGGHQDVQVVPHEGGVGLEVRQVRQSTAGSTSWAEDTAGRQSSWIRTPGPVLHASFKPHSNPRAKTM